MVDPNIPIILKGDPLPALRTRTVTGAQLSESGSRLSESGSGLRRLTASSSAIEVEIAATEEIPRPGRV